jgi:DNA-binding protein YbaB
MPKLSDETVHNLSNLADEADSYAQRLAAAQAAVASEEATGSDESGAVTVTIASSGVVRSIEIGQDWQQHLGVEDLGGAVVEAVQAAMISRLGVFAAALDEEEAKPAPAPKPRQPTGESFAAKLQEAIAQAPSPEAGQRALNELGVLLDEIEKGFDEMDALAESFVGATYEGRSRSGHVTATVSSGGALVGVTFDKRWLVNAHEYNISRETVAAIRTAFERAGEHTIQDVIAKSRFGQLAGTFDDPRGFARRLHLHTD